MLRALVIVLAALTIVLFVAAPKRGRTPRRDSQFLGAIGLAALGACVIVMRRLTGGVGTVLAEGTPAVVAGMIIHLTGFIGALILFIRARKT